MFTQAVKDHLKNDEYLHVNGSTDPHHHREKSNNDRFTPIEDGVQHNNEGTIHDIRAAVT